MRRIILSAALVFAALAQPSQAQRLRIVVPDTPVATATPAPAPTPVAAPTPVIAPVPKTG